MDQSGIIRPKIHLNEVAKYWIFCVKGNWSYDWWTIPIADNLVCDSDD